MPKTTTSQSAGARLADAAIRLLSTRKWEDLTFASVLGAAKLSWVDAFACAPSKSALFGLVLRWTAEGTVLSFRPDRRSESARERVFDTIMAWFDVQQQHKRALSSLYRGLRRDPFTLIAARGEIVGIAERLLAIAEADAGPLASARALCLSGVLARATTVWLDDDDEMGKTMSQLERDLRRLERVLWPQKISRESAEPRRSSTTKTQRTRRK